MRILKVASATILLLLSNVALSQYNATADYWKCDNRVGGSWSFGTVPDACDVDAFGSDSVVRDNFAPLIFDDSKDRNEERLRYVTLMNAAIRDIAEYYLDARKPTASAAEKNAWQYAVRAIANQESWWTHYRLATDGRLKMIRGDKGHGHGMMQFDDRWHFNALQQGKGWHLVEHVIYGLDVYYTQWQRAASASCVASASDWRARTRAAWAAYNGGGSKICRWTNPNDPWARNDQGFADKYDSIAWENWITNDNVASPIDVSCLAQGNENCGLPSTTGNTELQGRLLIVSDGRACVFDGGEFTCTDDRRDGVCLARAANVSIANGSLDINSSRLSGQSVNAFDRHDCVAQVTGLQSVGQVVRAQLDINVRATPGGLLVSALTAGTDYQILDFEVRDADSLKRYYLVRSGSVEGYVYAGNSGSWQSWMTPVSVTASDPVIATPGDWVEVTARNGINLRTSPRGAKIGVVANGAVVEVTDVTVIGNSNRLYYTVIADGQYGTIYGGQLLDQRSVAQWAVLGDAPQLMRTGQIGDNYWWVTLRSCDSSSCSATGYLAGGKQDEFCRTSSCNDRRGNVVELAVSGGWTQVRDVATDKVGWIADYLVDWN